MYIGAARLPLSRSQPNHSPLKIKSLMAFYKHQDKNGDGYDRSYPPKPGPTFASRSGPTFASRTWYDATCVLFWTLPWCVPLVTTTSISWRVSLRPITLPYVECAPTFSSAIAISHLFPDELICLFISHHTSAHMYSLIHIIVTINCSTFLAFHEVMYHCSILTCRTPSTLGAAGNPKSS